MRNIIFLILLFMATVKTKAQLNTDVDATLASNSQIRAVDHRALEKDIIASYEDFVGSYTTAQIAALTGMTARQVVYNITDKEYEFYDGTRWVKMAHPKYKVYVALLTQTSTNAPTAVVLDNTLGGTVVWSYDSVGQYVGTLNGAFTQDKTVIFIGTILGGFNIHNAYYNDVNSFMVQSYTVTDPPDFVDASLSTTPIEIRVYY